MTENENPMIFDTFLGFSEPVGNPNLVAESKSTDEMVSSPATSDRTAMAHFGQKSVFC